ncbi:MULTISPECIES: AraC family transcriptional regulator [unclassified Paenibacillus]|uniref:AraC family transcriptional regulator n=1 Tax=unclassified Paenibacillus TaxID=185978 RepID=UPI00240550C1|nr:MULTISPECIES: AraC family transcriptional regulator [unclassified Paenibacillus]MDF9844294.1 AraC-like DNA-binding protein [Paenibacillus sp. PastF-2]MDF9850917.1 AraC-like DNA-binding protein [Paenibacillus sp. PastM-2]MDF9857469.1 AraC-like DNA-binding protein [Paenibacillus sp. PastF-1]MDH6482755.1 AraC-like DNA-binding protein [Paenibacillus sp. PastH-2]MDH6510181.1 AraC-like DNA-binding protein [Paenibacillus sp. PastM-3]
MDRVLYIVNAEHEADTHIPRHQHECFELVYYIHGLGTCSIGQRSYHFRPHSFALIPPNFKHDENHQPRSEVLFVGFHCENPAISTLSGVFEDDKEHTVLQTLVRMNEEFKRKRDGFSELLNLQMSEITVHLQRLLGGSGFQSPAQDQMQYVLNYMDEHYRHKLSVQSLAEMSGYSYDRFRHLFKERFGESPHRYLLLKRINYAKSLLLHTLMHISEVSAAAGFVNDAQFCNMFKREVGLSPRTFRIRSKVI